jgi:hypothetical protein
VEHGTHNASYGFYLDVSTSNLYFDVPLEDAPTASVGLTTLEGYTYQILDSQPNYAYGLRVLLSRNVFFWFTQEVVNYAATGMKIVIGPLTPPGGPAPVSRSVALEWCVASPM